MNDTSNLTPSKSEQPAPQPVIAPIAAIKGIPETLTAQVITSPEIDKISAALAKAQGAVKAVIKSEEGKVKGTSKGTGRDYEYTYNYAGLDAVMDAIRKAASDNSLAVIQRFPAGKAGLHSLLVHASGQWIDYGLYSLGTPSTHQEKGGAITYARRYTVQCIFGVAPQGEDDDAERGNDALGRELPKGSRQRKTVEQVDDFGPPIEIPGDDTQVRAPGAAKTDKEARADYNAAKDKCKIKQEITPDGYIDFDAVAAGLEKLIPEAKSINELSMIKKANANSLDNMAADRPDLFDHLSKLIQTTFTKLA